MGRGAPRPCRAGIAVATGSDDRDPAALRASLHAYLEALGTDYLDAFFVEYVHPGEDVEAIHGEGGALAEVRRWKEEGTVRFVGATAHDRTVSRRLAADARVDVLMQRYNMAHRKAAEEVFPVCVEHDVAVIAFTATRWGSLPAGHPEWPGDAPSALDCYRFCAAEPSIQSVLAAPANAAELDEDLKLLSCSEMSAAEQERWCRYGDLVYGDGTDSFETDWP